MLRLITSCLFDRFPRLAVIVGHLGETAEMGAERVLFSTDYPYESMREAADLFDNAAINDNDRIKIGRSNSEKLFRLKQLAAARPCTEYRR